MKGTATIQVDDDHTHSRFEYDGDASFEQIDGFLQKLEEAIRDERSRLSLCPIHRPAINAGGDFSGWYVLQRKPISPNAGDTGIG